MKGTATPSLAEISPAAAPRRRSGRPKNSEARVGAEELVRQCLSMLDETPPSKVTFSALARHAGVTPALINYYFKDRSALFVAVLRHIIQGVQLRLQPSDAPGASAEEDLRLFIVDMVRIHREHPFFHDLLLDEVVHARTAEGRLLFEETTDYGLGLFRNIFERAQAEGLMRPADPIYVYFAILGMCAFFATARPILDYLTDGAGRELQAAAYLDEISTLVLRGLARDAVVPTPS